MKPKTLQCPVQYLKRWKKCIGHPLDVKHRAICDICHRGIEGIYFHSELKHM